MMPYKGALVHLHYFGNAVSMLDYKRVLASVRMTCGITFGTGFLRTLLE